MPRLKEAVGRNHGLSPDTVHHGVSGGRRTPEMAAEKEEERTVAWRERQHVEEGEGSNMWAPLWHVIHVSENNLQKSWMARHEWF